MAFTASLFIIAIVLLGFILALLTRGSIALGEWFNRKRKRERTRVSQSWWGL